MAVQSGLLDALPVADVVRFSAGLREALDQGAAEAVRAMQDTGKLDDAQKQSIQDVLHRYSQAITPPKKADDPAAVAQPA